MSLEKKTGIEPLSDGRWARVERALFMSLPDEEVAGHRDTLEAAPPATRWRGATALMLTGALAAALGAVTWRALGQSDMTPGPTRIATAANGSRVEVGESTVEVGPQSAVRVSGDDAHGISVLLDTGRVECDVAPRRGRPPFVVEAGAVEVRVVGTHFVVTRTGDAVTVDVQRGRVEVLSGHEHAIVDAGTRWPANEGSVAPAVASAPFAALEPLPAAGDPTLNGGSAKAFSAESRASGTAPARPTPRDPSRREQYESATKLEAQKPNAAIATYSELARQGGPWAMNALFAEGRLQDDRGRRGDATRLLQEYLTRYPFGPNAEDARRLLQRMR